MRAGDIVPLLQGRTAAAVQQMAEAPLVAVDGAWRRVWGSSRRDLVSVSKLLPHKARSLTLLHRRAVTGDRQYLMSLRYGALCVRPAHMVR